MKNKKMLLVLIAGTLIVWGLIIYKIIAGIHSDDDSIVLQHAETVIKEETLPDTFSIDPTYRDPFLGKIQNREVVYDEQPAQPRVVSKPIVTPTAAWPTVAYHGIIKNSKLKKEMILLEVNGQEHMVKIGEIIEGILLSKAYRDSVEVQFSKEKKIIHK
ncbi:MAG TPA: hypothetical protein VFF27_16250 [Bacteroidia bacterium]|jgi:type II secretory pathway component PulC|nr:hypothetical protein [Bacteroidia bacterium]